MAERIGLIRSDIKGIHQLRFDETVLEKTVLRMKEIFNGYNLLVVVVPSRALWAGVDLKTADKIHRAFIQHLDQQGVEYLDLRPTFEAHLENPMGLHYKNDGHWNKAGNALASEAIVDYLHVREKLSGL